MKNNKKKKGFTLIELIVVLAILAIIAALAIPSFRGLKAEATQSIADANARTVYTAAQACLAMGKDPKGTALQDMLGDMKGTFKWDGKIATWEGNGKKGTYPKS